jgi:cysteine desulfurase
MPKTIYLDYNATTPIDPEVLDAMLPYLREHFGNPSSAHSYGRDAHAAIERARKQVASLLNCDPGEILFTSGGTESNNMVIKSVAEVRSEQGKHIITSAVEHPAILEPCAWLAAQGYEVTILPVDAMGRVRIAALESAIRPDTILISIMLANNEVGTVQPIAEISAIAHEYGVTIHTDAAQAVGKIPVDVQELGVDFLTAAGHKLYAPKGVGVLYVRSGVQLPKFMHGAGHEGNRRAGTENVPYIAGLGQAAAIAQRDLVHSMVHMKAMRDRLHNGLCDCIPAQRRNGDSIDGLPNTLSISFRNVEANILLARIADRVAASAGAACHADSITVSKVLQAMNVPLDYAMGTVRFSAGKITKADEIDEAVQVIAEAVALLRA